MKHVRCLTSAVVLAALLSGCGEPRASLQLADVPVYPNAVKRESMQGVDPMFGRMKAELIQYSTLDGHDSVLEYYRDRLDSHAPEVVTHDPGAGRQTAITIDGDDGGVTVAIQEDRDRRRVMITHMRVGR